MAMVSGDVNASGGMAKAIFDQLDAVLGPDVPPAALPDVEAAWRKLSFAVATAVTQYLTRDPASEPEFAETRSSAADDAQYWAWLQGFATTFTTGWAPTGADGIALRNAMNNFLGGHPVPTELRGSLR